MHARADRRARAPAPTRSTTTPCSTLLELADARDRRPAGAACEFVVVRDPDVRHQLARTYRQGWSIYKRVLAHPQPATTPMLEARQWESDHFEDVPGP